LFTAVSKIPNTLRNVEDLSVGVRVTSRPARSGLCATPWRRHPHPDVTGVQPPAATSRWRIRRFFWLIRRV